MFHWIKEKFLSWFGSRSTRLDVYHPGERMIFSYFDGEKMVRVDPLEMYRRIMDQGPELSVDLSVSTSISKDAGKAHLNVVKRIRDIFRVKPFDEGGLTEPEAAELLDQFLEYCASIKKNTNLPAMPLKRTGDSPTTSEPVAPPTSASSDSGSSDSGSCTGGPKSSPSESPLPSDSSTPESPTTGPSATEKEKP